MPRLNLIKTLLAWLALPACCAASNVGMFTILDGDATVLRDTRRFAAAEGLHLRDDDIVRTGANARLVRIEFADGTLLDIGPGTELLLQPGALTGSRRAALYLARGWVKLTLAAGRASELGGIATPRFDLPRLAGTAVVRVAPQAALVFVESGRAEIEERAVGLAVGVRSLGDGDAWTLEGAAGGTLLQRNPEAALREMPRAFADSLPRRAARFSKTVPPQPGEGMAVSYEDVALWINAEAALRPSFVQRFAAMSRDRLFRASLLAELKAHPEWKRVLYPADKARAKATAVARQAAPPAKREPTLDAAPSAATPAATPAGAPGAPATTLQWPSTLREIHLPTRLSEVQ